MKKLNYILIGFLFIMSSSLFAQQESTFTFYKYHMNMINPAYAGMGNQTLGTSSIRTQWTGIVDAPKTQAVSFGTTLGHNLGFGVSVVNDRTFVEKQTFVGVDFSYKLQMSETIDLYLGLKAGGNFYNVNTSGLETYAVQSDPALGSISTFNPNLGVGAVLKNNKFFVSLSIPRILNTQNAKNENGYAMVATDRPHVYLSGGYDFDLNPSLVLKPSVLLRYVNGAPASLDLNTMLQIENNFEIGGTYRTDKAYAAMANITLSKRFVFGFAYEMSTRPELASAKNTNEILLQFKF
nr:type IX secretion system membrane protein PorP/SprF [uncultured Flavobacterium sp.]